MMSGQACLIRNSCESVIENMMNGKFFAAACDLLRLSSFLETEMGSVMQTPDVRAAQRYLLGGLRLALLAAERCAKWRYCGNGGKYPPPGRDCLVMDALSGHTAICAYLYNSDEDAVMWSSSEDSDTWYSLNSFDRWAPLDEVTEGLC